VYGAPVAALKRSRPVSLDELRERFETIHGQRRTEATYQLALLDVSLQVWRRQLENVARAEAKLREAVARADEWRAICEGLAHQAARARDAVRPPTRAIVMFSDTGEPIEVARVPREKEKDE
jgi:hypothetical protein